MPARSSWSSRSHRTGRPRTSRRVGIPRPPTNCPLFASIRDLPRPSPTAPNEPSTIQRRPKAALPRRRLGERHVIDGKRLEPSPKPLSATGIPALYVGICALEDLAGGTGGG